MEHEHQGVRTWLSEMSLYDQEVEVVRLLEELYRSCYWIRTGAYKYATTRFRHSATSTREQTIVTFLVSFRIWIPFC